MSGRKVRLAGSVVLLVLLLGFGCSLLQRDAAVPASGGWYIKLQVQAPGSKGITVSDFNVTGLNIQVRDPAGEVLQSIDWAAAQGTQTYMVQVKQVGEHHIEVTHFGERNGEAVQATESAAFSIQAMKITVIDVVPGCIGMIRFEGEEPSGGGGTISGRVYDWVTGAGISGATVVFGNYSAATDISGVYSITVDAPVSALQGVFAAFKGLDYQFRVCGSISIDPTTDPVFDIGLMPADSTGYAQRSLGGTIRDNTGAGIGEAHLWLEIKNENGGRGSSETGSNSVGGYATTTQTFGADCFVIVNVEHSSENPLFLYYLTGQDLSADLSSFNLQQPPSADFTTVSLLGSQYSMFEGYLVVPNYGWVSYASGDLFSSSQVTLNLYNPNDYPMCWYTQTASFDTPGPGDLTVWINGVTLPFSNVISLPVPYSQPAPSATVDGTTASWNGSTRTLAWEAVDGANGYLAFLADYSTEDPRFYGYILMNSSFITLPSEFVSAVMDRGQGWDLGVWPAWSPQADAEEVLRFALSFESGGQGPPLGDFQVAIVQTGDVTKADIIP